MKDFYARDYGLIADGKTDNVKKLAEMLAAVKAENAPSRVVFESGVYLFSCDSAERKLVFISNTVSEREAYPPYRLLPFHLENMSDVEIDGGGAMMLMDGTMTNLAIENCKNITVKNLAFEHECPSVADLTVKRVTPFTVTFAINKDCRYRITEDKRLEFAYKNYELKPFVKLKDDGRYNMKSTENRISRGASPFLFALRAKETAPYEVKVTYGIRPKCKVGDVYMVRNSERTEVGVLINHSQNVVLDGLKLHFMHGLGICGQMSDTLTLKNSTLAPRENSGRTSACFADFCHFPSCKGLITVTDCYFAGSHDDAINIHGIYFRVAARKGNVLTLRFMHPQAYGLDVIEAGHILEFSDGATLLPFATAKILSVAKLNDYDTEVEVDGLPNALPSNCCAEDTFWTASAFIARNTFSKIATRAILYTAGGKGVITDNLFDRINMNSVVIAGDARYWYESGRISELLIENNTFYHCERPVVYVNPEVFIAGKLCHKNLTVKNNRFIFAKSAKRIVSIRQVENFVFEDNEVSIKK